MDDESVTEGETVPVPVQLLMQLMRAAFRVSDFATWEEADKAYLVSEDHIQFIRLATLNSIPWWRKSGGLAAYGPVDPSS